MFVGQDQIKEIQTADKILAQIKAGQEILNQGWKRNFKTGLESFL